MQLLQRGLALNKHDSKRIWIITLPAMFELVLSQLFGMVDTIMLGQTAMAAPAIAAMGLTNNPINLMNGIMIAFNVGATAAVAWAIGAEDQKMAKAITRNILVLDLFMGIISMLLGTVFARQIVLFMGAQPDTLAYAQEYLFVISVGFLPTALTMGVTACLRGIGLTRIPMVYNLVSNLLNVFLNYAMIYGHFGFPEMGVLGASLSTTICRFVAMGLALGFLFLGNSQIRISIRDSFKLRLSIVKEILRVGLPNGIEQFIMQLGFMLFTKTVSGLGTTVLAAHNIGLNINGLSWVPSQAFGVASTTLAGQSMGAGEPKKVRDQIRMIHRCSLLVSLFVAVLFLTCAQWIVRLYISDATILAMSTGALHLIALGMPSIATQIPIAGALRGVRDSKFPLIASMCGIWIFRVFVAPLLIYNLGLGLNGAWLSIVLDQTARACIIYARFHRGKWMSLAFAPGSGPDTDPVDDL